MLNSRPKIVVFLLSLLCLITHDITRMSLAAMQPSFGSLQDIENFLNQKKYQDAYQLAEKLSNQQMGEPSFDLLFGKTALAVHKPDVASLAFERVLMSEPGNVAARYGLVESYYELKMYDKAKIETQSLILSPYGSALSVETQLLLAKIKKGESTAREKLYKVYGRMVFGYDNNVDANTDEDYGRYLDLTKIPLNYDKNDADQVASYNAFYNKLKQYNRKLKSIYIYPQLGIGGKYVPKPKYGLFWDVNASHKDYLEGDIKGYNIDQINLSFGVNYKFSPLYLLNGSVYYQEYLLGGERYRETPFGSISLSRILNANNTIKIYTNNGILSYPNYTSLSTNMYSVGLEWNCSNVHDLLITQVFYGGNLARGGAPAYNSNDFYGFDISLKHQLTRKTSLTANAIYQRSLYAGVDIITTPLAPIRHDSFKQFSVGAYYKFHPRYTWYVLGAYTKNNSNVFLYEYDRFEALTGIGFDF